MAKIDQERGWGIQDPPVKIIRTEPSVIGLNVNYKSQQVAKKLERMNLNISRSKS